MFKTSHRPDGKIADALALILACTTVTDASMNYSMYVPQRPSKVPIAPMGIDGKMAGVLALTHACTTTNALVNYSRYVPKRPSKVPIAPMGKWLTLLHRLSLALASTPLARTLRSTTVGTCHSDLLIVHHH